MQRHRLKISNNSPVILAFVAICVIVRLLDSFTGNWISYHLCSVCRTSFGDPLTYVRCFLHVFGHGSWEHLFSNMLYILILGPMLEEKYGPRAMITLILTTAFATGIATILLFPSVQLMGASGVVFAMILLSSFTGRDDGTVPLTFILVAVMYLGMQIYEGLFVSDNVSQFAHIIGGAVGSFLGFELRRR